MPASQSWAIRTPGLQQGVAVVDRPMCVVEALLCAMVMIALSAKAAIAVSSNL